MILFLTDSTGFPRDDVDSSLDQNRTFPMWCADILGMRLLHAGLGGWPTPRLKPLFESNIFYYSSSISHIVIACGVVDSSPRAIRKEEVYQLNKLLGIPSLMKEIFSENHARISEARGWPTWTSADTYYLSLYHLIDYTFTQTSFKGSISIMPIQPCCKDMEKGCPTFNDVQRPLYNDQLSRLSNEFDRVNFFRKELSFDSITPEFRNFFVDDGHHFTSSGHRILGKRLSALLVQS